MRTFRDSAGQEWTLDLTIEAVKRIRTVAGFDLLKDEDLQQALRDPIVITDVLWAVCKPQADQLGLADVEFGKRLLAELRTDVTVFETAVDQFGAELADFFRHVGRRSVAALLTKTLAANVEIDARANRRVTSDKADAAIAAAIDRAERAIDRELETLISGRKSGDSAASSESTPGP